MFSSFSYFSLAIRIFCFFAHFILLVLLLLIWIWAKKGWRRFPSLLLLIFFLFFFWSLCFYSFHILRWDLLRLFGEANGRDTFFRILNYEKKTLYFLKIVFWTFKTIFVNTVDIWILVCIKSLFVFVVFFVFFRFLIGDSVCFSCQKIRIGYIWFSWYF